MIEILYELEICRFVMQLAVILTASFYSVMTSFLLVFNPSTDSLLRPVQLKTNVFRLTKNSGKVDLLKIDITFIEISNE